MNFAALFLALWLISLCIAITLNALEDFYILSQKWIVVKRITEITFIVPIIIAVVSGFIGLILFFIYQAFIGAF